MSWPGRLALLCLALGLASASLASQVYQAQVTSVIDGDTVWVRVDGESQRRKLRLLGIDAPEICQAGGRASRLAMRSLVLGKRVLVSQTGMDTFGRGLAMLQRDGVDVAAQLVMDGHAWAAGVALHGQTYREQEASARQGRRGLFAADQPQWPGDFRKQHGSCYATRTP